MSIGKRAAAFSSGTFLSRISGMLREVMFAMIFGTSAAIAAFFVAFRFATLLRRLLGESPLSSSFIPHFETQRAGGEKQGALFFRDFYVSLALVLLFIVVGLELALLGATSEIMLWTRWMLPGLFFICLSGLNSAYLQCNKHFFISGVAPLFFNLTLIVILLIYKNNIPYLTFGVVIAYGMQFLITFPKGLLFLKKELSFKELFAIRPFSPEVRRLFVPFGMGIFGMGASQVNSALDMIFARIGEASGPAFLTYAIRIYQLPLALFGISFAAALLPSLSRANAEEKKFLCEGTLRKSFFILCPAMCVLFVLGFAGVNLVYGHGNFNVLSGMRTTHCLWAYGIGLLPAAFALILTQVFYAKKDFKTPMKGALIAVIVNIVLNSIMIFLFKWGAISVAFATSFSSVVNCLYLLYRMPFSLLFHRRSYFKVILGSCSAGIVAYFAGRMMDVNLDERRILMQLLQFAVPALCFVGVYLGVMAKTAKTVLAKND